MKTVEEIYARINLHYGRNTSRNILVNNFHNLLLHLDKKLVLVLIYCIYVEFKIIEEYRHIWLQKIYFYPLVIHNCFKIKRN